MMAGSERVVHAVFACDVWKGSRLWLQGLGAPLILADMNVRAWNTKAGAITSKDIEGNDVTITRQDAGLDIYVWVYVHTVYPTW